MKHVAQALLGIPPSLAVLERDFCIAGQVISRKRGSLDPAMVGMFLFLRAEYDEIPQEIRSLNEAEMRSAISERLKDVVWLKEMEPLETGPSPAASSDEPEGIISDNEDDSADEQDDSEDERDDGDRKKGKAEMDVRGWGGSSGRNVNSMKKNPGFNLYSILFLLLLSSPHRVSWVQLIVAVFLNCLITRYCADMSTWPW